MLGLLLLTPAGPALAEKVAGVTLDDRIVYSETPLTLNGAGIRKKLFIKLYVGSLYVDETLAGSDADTIMKADAPMVIQLDIISDLLTRDKLVKALNDGFNKSTEGNTAPIQAEIDAMHDAFDQPVRPNETYRIAYDPDVGTSILRDEQNLIDLPGLPFKQAIFGIWLSSKPAQKSLKKAMLGS